MINTNMSNINGSKYPIKSANGPNDFSKVIFTASPFLNCFPALTTSMTLLSTSDTEQVAFVWQVEHPETLSRLTFIVFGVMSLITPRCSMEPLIVSVVISLYLKTCANVDRLLIKKIDNCQFSKNKLMFSNE